MVILTGLFVWVLVVFIMGILDGVFPMFTDITILSVATLLGIVAAGYRLMLETK